MAIWMVRHGETEWSISGRHAGSTDIPLTPNGRLQATAIGKLLTGRRFDHVLSSPMLRARETAGLAGFGDRRLHEGLLEYDYGELEGLTTGQIRAIHPGWQLFRDGCPGGETPEQMAKRVDALIEQRTSSEATASCSGTATASGRSPSASWTCRSDTPATS
jgi:probable phosphoglycerate mutase